MEESWAILDAEFWKFHSKEESQLSFEHMYRHAYKLVLRKNGAWLYERIMNWHKVWLQHQVSPKFQLAATEFGLPSVLRCKSQGTAPQNGELDGSTNFLRTFNEAFHAYSVSVEMIEDIVVYMVCFSLSSVTGSR